MKNPNAGLMIAQISPEKKDIEGNLIKDTSIITELNQVENLFAADNHPPIFIEFYMNGCGPCQMTAPIWHTMIKIAKRKFATTKLAIVSIESKMMEQIKNNALKSIAQTVKGFPTIGMIINKKFIAYEGGRAAKLFISFIKKHLQHQNGGSLNIFKTLKKYGSRTRRSRRSRRSRNKNTHRRRRRS